MSWRNFSVWRGRLPHWRADDVSYFVTFRHSRDLRQTDIEILIGELKRSDGRRWDLIIACVLPSRTDLLARVRRSPSDEPYELSDIVEKVKSRAGKAILRASGERFPPFYGESYDRIVRNPAELETMMDAIVSSPVDAELAESPDEYEHFVWGRSYEP